MRQFACHPALLKLRQQFLQGEFYIPHHREAGGVGASQLVHIRRELIHRAGFRNGLALAIQNGNQASAADDKHRIVGINDAGDFICGGGHIAAPERVLRGEGQIQRPGGAVDVGTERFRKLDNLLRRAAGVNFIPRHNHDPAGRNLAQLFGQFVQRARHGVVVHFRGRLYPGVAQLFHHVHWQG